MDSIEIRLRDLAFAMHSVSLVMLGTDQSRRMNSKGLELQGASTVIREWVTSMDAERTILRPLIIILAVLALGCSPADKPRQRDWPQTCLMCGATVRNPDEKIPPTVEWCFNDSALHSIRKIGH